MAIEAWRIALKYMTPVAFLSDAFLANGAEPWPIPDATKLKSIAVPARTEKEGFYPYLRDPETLARPWAVPGTPGLEHRIGGLEKSDVVGNVSYDADNHHRMQVLRQAKVAGIAGDIPPLEVHGEAEGDLLILGWGSTYGAIRSAVERLQARGLSVSHAHLRHLNPLPANTGEVLGSFKRVLIPELNLGQLLMLIRARYLIDAVGYNKVRGKPFRISEIEAEAERILAGGRAASGDPAAATAAGLLMSDDRHPCPIGGERRMTTEKTTANGGALSPENAAVLEGMKALPVLTRKDFVSDQEVRWCPGCGDYSILAQTQKVMPDFGYARENIVFISGIGCSGRLPYYMNTYGFHTIHGRAPAIATGLKAARPDLMVWVITGDGDALSIGGNHLVHSLRRNVDLRIVMFNNRIYGLTKGQASPTSEFGKVTKSSPFGTIDYPVSPLAIALAAEASFIARSVDTHTEHLQGALEAAGKHRGSAFLEVLQNCNIFNDGAFRDFTDREVRDDRMLVLEHGKPMLFGKDRTKGIRLNGHQPEIVTIGENGISVDDILVHDETDAADRVHAREDLVARLPGTGGRHPPHQPADPRRADHEPDRAGHRRSGQGRPGKLLAGGETWVVSGDDGE